ncbi:hypothetical protein IGK80_002182 [Enterococcus sp. DIV0609]|uniref:hypothetical protein n=1 Tax=unclassified Enterococcus TaxID=2608891 RepID=UPI00192259AE|nr:hypothetical protein [Enterococcus faecalis]HAP4761853.1 hypothetical protein [Enterococcus faecalis]
MKKLSLTFLGIIFLSAFISGCSTASDQTSERSSEAKTSSSQTDITEPSNELSVTSETANNTEPLQTNSSNSNIDNSAYSSTSNENEFEANAKKYPADSVATFEGAKFSGMKYLYSGKVLTKVTANSVSNLILTSYLVENDRGYRMLVTPPYEVEIPDGVTLEVKGTLNGNVYDLESASLSGINKKAGLINGSTIIINGKTLGIDYFSPSDL